MARLQYPAGFEWYHACVRGRAVSELRNPSHMAHAPSEAAAQS
ncbi:Uncharacterised protein [Vibrio cholerae]|nr:Uncharacterised protein [Vibrio cholerae]